MAGRPMDDLRAHLDALVAVMEARAAQLRADRDLKRAIDRAFELGADPDAITKACDLVVHAGA